MPRGIRIILALSGKKGLLELPHIFNKVIEKNPNVRLILAGKDVVQVLSTEPGWLTEHPTGTTGDWAGRRVGSAVAVHA